MRTAVIIGAGPAGLTAAFELLQRTDIVPIVLEAEDYVGGISRTANYKGNRIDIGGHRFFSKSERVMQWWLDRMPLQQLPQGQLAIGCQHKRGGAEASGSGPDPERCDRVMLLRSRKSRIYFLRTFFDYPITLTGDTIRKLGLARIVRIGFSYLRAVLFPFRPEKNLEEFFINRFGREVYRAFFKSYTEKVWGERCSSISAEWGEQRIKGLSILGSLRHVFRKLFSRGGDLAQKETETSLIEQFLYPKYGPGQMWELVAAEIVRRGGRIVHHQRVRKLYAEGDRIVAVEAVAPGSGAATVHRGDWFFSTMPVKELIASLDAEAPAGVRQVSEGLIYRDFITVGMLLSDLKIREDSPQGRQAIRDNWIYIQEPDVRLGRLQVFNNWSPYMPADRAKTWIGLEYFCYETDDLWKMSDQELIELGVKELVQIGVIERSAVLDATVIRMPKTYPAYFGTYDRFHEIRRCVDRFENLFLVGRNGMHRYNNQDHSMLTAMVAVDNIIAGIADKSNVWAVNTEQDYHESKGGEKRRGDRAPT
ncbi:MAG: NAD(P)/FAD-dependent oxidoreductase [Thermoguttaceae bacterium]|jgi:protoporphyrinogen oxidase